MNKKISYHKFVRNTILLSIFLILIIFSLFTIYFHSTSIEKSIKNDTQIMADLVFQNLYTVMKNGGDHKVINETIVHLQENIPGVKIGMFSKKDINNIDIINQAFDSKKSDIIRRNSHLDFASPVLFKNECLKCHTNAQQDDVASVIYIEHPIMDLKIPLKEMLTMIGILFLIIVVVFFSTWYHLLTRYFVRPILNLATQIDKSKSHNDLEDNIQIDTTILEIKHLEIAFNKQNKELMTSYRQIVNQSNTDSLTQIFNRKKFDEYSQVFLNESKRYNHTFSLVLIDLNKFKPINDTFGHDVGDKVLIFFSKVISKIIRKSDFFFRTGGDEFILLLPNTSTDNANKLIEKIKNTFKEKKFKDNDLEIELSASFGICEYSANFEDINSMIKIADTNMYEDKKKYGGSR